MTPAEVNAALERARRATFLERATNANPDAQAPLTADVEALAAAVTRLRAHAAELDNELHQSRAAWIEQQKHLRGRLEIAVECLEVIGNDNRGFAPSVGTMARAALARIRGEKA